MKAAAIIQARISSTRLQAKALLELSGKPMIFHVIERAKAIRGIDRVILATGSEEKNISLLEIAEQCNIETYAGSENDVLERYYMTASKIYCDYIIRITGDNPLTDHESASEALVFAQVNDADHCTVSGIPTGTGIEVIKKSALEKTFREGKEPHHREHVTPYIKEHPEIFKSIRYISPLNNPFPDLRLTVDEAEDLELMKIIYNNLYKGSPINLQEVISFIRQNPELRLINNSVIQRPMTHHSSG